MYVCVLFCCCSDTFDFLRQATCAVLPCPQAYYREKGGYMERKKLHNLCVFSKQYQEAGMLAVRQAYMQVLLSYVLPAFARACRLQPRR